MAMDAAQTGSLNVFISYRRADSPGHAGRVHDALRRQFGKEHVFFDVTAIEGGIDFGLAIRDAIDRSAVVAVIIGPSWGRRKVIDRILSRPDWARFEIQYARQAGKPILPVLVGGAAMPGSLPPSLEFLSTIHALSLRDESWEDDVARLTSRLPIVAQTTVASSPAGPAPARTRKALMVSVLALALVSIWAGPRLWRMIADDRGPEPLPGAATSANPGAPPDSSAQVSAPDRGSRALEGRGSPSNAVPSGRGSSLPAAPNRPPTRGTIDVDIFNRIGVVAATRFTLTAKDIADPDGDKLQYRWEFGDGSSLPSAGPTVSKVFRDVGRWDVALFVNDGRMEEDVEVASTDITVRSLDGTWRLTLELDPKRQPEVVSDTFTVELKQQGNQLSGTIAPPGDSRSTFLTGEVKHPMDVSFGSESAWWNGTSDAYFDLHVSDRALMMQMSNRTPGRCSYQIPCLSARMTRQK